MAFVVRPASEVSLLGNYAVTTTIFAEQEGGLRQTGTVGESPDATLQDVRFKKGQGVEARRARVANKDHFATGDVKHAAPLAPT